MAKGALCSLGLEFLTKLRRRCVHVDEFGNRYYSAVVRGSERRWVVYGGRADPSTVTARCHLWLHYTSDDLPPAKGSGKHVPNLTGTAHAYHPHCGPHRQDSGDARS
ncbi:NADH-ubiquinone oxidoreductase subunit NDUFA12 family protein [Anaplasma capra]|uniref:NADH-ubiquinone oxidoreductase subunit NDUFA12 family protein n=1 Tax=Anaplasma capra TaxID=1562740 RepID=UPI0021D5BCC8|nr:NADH-ubiquinone oxidoreductase subunit NDUFA12 family protein [Anaplasma capra]MCU7611259.1 NADH-ubiquinone oxidoreductase subunit NDUFA12 family protein [Anaplasma capra]MCU7612686.1 NADH-ubiquinone oxidoreductase subunit NDUFA12 family protein [Anaplasma capra]